MFGYRSNSPENNVKDAPLINKIPRNQIQQYVFGDKLKYYLRRIDEGWGRYYEY